MAQVRGFVVALRQQLQEQQSLVDSQGAELTIVKNMLRAALERETELRQGLEALKHPPARRRR